MEKENKDCNCKTPTNKEELKNAIKETIYTSRHSINLMRRIYILFLFIVYQIETTITSAISYLFTGTFKSAIDPILRTLIEIEEHG